LKDTFEERDLFARFQGKRSVSIWVYRVGEQNALDVAEKVKSYIQNIKSTLPHGVNVEVFGDRSEILRARLMLLLKNMAYGMILVIILLGLFLNYKLSFWITLGIPIAFATGLWLIPRYDVSINMISLFAFIMVLGIVVDDAIVIGENVFRRREAGEPPLSSAIEGTLEVGRPVIFSVLTTMAAFWPLLMGSGVMGKVIRQIPIVVILVLVGSLIEALLILPAHLARTRLPEKKSKKEAFVSNCLFSFIDGPYKKTLTLALQWRYATIAIGIFILLISLGLWFGGILKFTFFPEVQSDRMVAEVTMPVGTPPEVTDRITRYLEDKAIEAAEEIESKNNMNTNLIRYIFTIVGEQIPMGHRASTGPPPTGGNVGQVIVQLIGSEQRQDIPTNLVASVWRQKTGEIVGAESLVFYSELFSAGKAISFDLTMEDNESLLMAVDELKDQLRRFPGVYEVEDSYIPGKEELRINLKPSARALGLTLNDIARQVRAAFYGEEALRIQRGRDEIKVMVRYPSEERKRLLSLMNMRIITPDGNQVPLTEVATIKSSRGYVTITRRDQKRIITVSAEVDEAVATPTEIRNEIVKKIMPRLMEKYPGLRYEISGEGKEQSQSMADVFKGFLLALVLIYALLAVPLRSFTQPIVIMSAIPFGIIGAIVAHLILGINLSIMSLFGVVGLSGVVVNDSLILFDAINRLRRQGLEIEQAILKGTAMRFRAVILTTVTTFGGLLPMITEKSVQAQFLIPMALSLAGGVVFASVITLVLVPCGYRIMEDILTIKKRL
jgi:multidrug efflux pump subunit AcrB